ncbi:MFS transporter [Nevskia soli]|uniref:MFS transporter n=1 Tax=Nevskia soli TaxID=418856 RepID=UPI0004A6DE31
MPGKERSAGIIEIDIPARLDALGWGRFHSRIVVALGITWMLDGLEVTLAGSVAGALKTGLHMSDAQVGLSASAYLAGAVLGALLFGWLADRYGRKPLFLTTLGLYLASTALSGLAPDYGWFAAFRFFTGAGIGGEYSAISSAIQEFTPARYRGRTDLIVNGSFWLGAALGAVTATVLLDARLLPPGIGWRMAFGVGTVLGCGILLLRRSVPESPRWLMIQGRLDEAESIVRDIESRGGVSAVPGSERTRLHPRAAGSGVPALLRALFHLYPQRTAVALTLMTAQAFFYNAIFFTYALVLGRFFGVAPGHVGLYLLPFAVGNFLGPLLLGHYFDSVGRRPMMALTYAASGVLLLLATALFVAGLLTAATQTLAWTLVFFFASAAASSAYLTIGESFPMEVRALAISTFYALGTALGGIGGPALFGALVANGEHASLGWGYVLGAGMMLVAAVVAWRYGVQGENRGLEDVTALMSRLD